MALLSFERGVEGSLDENMMFEKSPKVEKGVNREGHWKESSKQRKQPGAWPMSLGQPL